MPLGDPFVRPFTSGCRRSTTQEFAERRFPVLFDLVGFMGSGASHTNWKAFGENVPERAARLIHQKRMEPAIVVFPDCFTALGGNQYINSSADRPLCRLSDAGARALRRRTVPHARVARAPRLLRQELGRLRRHRARHAVSEDVGRGRRSLRRRVLRFRLWCRLAEHARRAGQVRVAEAQGRTDRRGLARVARRASPRTRRRPRARFLADLRKKKKLGKDDGHTRDEPLHGRDLRPRPASAERLSPAVPSRDRRADRVALEALARARSDPHGQAPRARR